MTPTVETDSRKQNYFLKNPVKFMKFIFTVDEKVDF